MGHAPYRFPKTLFSDLNDEIVRRLRQARYDAGLNQVDAAARLGCRQTFISKIECGGRRVDVAELLIILQAYGIEPAEFLKDLPGPKWTPERSAPGRERTTPDEP
jgi:transcriptional regulator with XRE-family HTH domain